MRRKSCPERRLGSPGASAPSVGQKRTGQATNDGPLHCDLRGTSDLAATRSPQLVVDAVDFLSSNLHAKVAFCPTVQLSNAAGKYTVRRAIAHARMGLHTWSADRATWPGPPVVALLRRHRDTEHENGRALANRFAFRSQRRLQFLGDLARPWHCGNVNQKMRAAVGDGLLLRDLGRQSGWFWYDPQGGECGW